MAASLSCARLTEGPERSNDSKARTRENWDRLLVGPETGEGALHRGLRKHDDIRRAHSRAHLTEDELVMAFALPALAASRRTRHLRAG